MPASPADAVPEPALPDTLNRLSRQLLAGLILVFLCLCGLMLADLNQVRQQQLRQGEQDIRHFAILLAGHASRSLSAVDILLRQLRHDLQRQGNWWQWSARQGFDYLQLRHPRFLPQLRDLILFDQTGQQRFISTRFPAPVINVHDRGYFRQLLRGELMATDGPFVGRNSGQYTYGMAFRLDRTLLPRPSGNTQGNPPALAGAVFAALEIAYFQEFCAASRLHPQADAVMVNARGIVVSGCGTTDLSQHSTKLGRPFFQVLGAGVLQQMNPATLPRQGSLHYRDWLLHIEPVAKFGDLQVIVLLPQQALLAGWTERLKTWGILLILSGLILALSGRKLLQHLRRLAEQATCCASAQQKLACDRDALQAMLNDYQAEISLAQRARLRFMAAASHDLRQPVTSIGLLLEALRRDLQGGHWLRAQDTSSNLHQVNQQLRDMLDTMLIRARLDNEELQPDFSPLDLPQLLENLNRMFQPSAAQAGHTLRFRGLRQPPADLCSNAQLLKALLGNLIENAIKYTPAPGRILVAARLRADRLLIEVRDNGIGIAHENQQLIFNEFVQLGNRARVVGKGIGLGLSTVKKLAATLRATIELRAAPRHGSRFCLCLPRRPAATPIPADPVRILPACPNAQMAGTLPAMAVRDMLQHESATARQPAPRLPAHPPEIRLPARKPTLLLALDARTGHDSLADLAATLPTLLANWGYPVVVLATDTTVSTLQALLQTAAAPFLLLLSGQTGQMLLQHLAGTAFITLPVIFWRTDQAETVASPADGSGPRHYLSLPLRPLRLRALLNQDWTPPENQD